MYTSSAVAPAVCSAIFPVFAGIAVGLRFYARKTKNLPYKSDDYLIIAALVFAIAVACIVFEGSFNGYIGQYLTKLNPKQYTVLQKHLYTAVITSQLSVGFSKCSVIMLYKRIFYGHQKFNIAANIVLVLTVLWMAAAFFTQVFSAWPVSNFWTYGKGFDMNYHVMVTSFAALDIFLDILILSLPLPVIKSLQMSLKRKIQVIGILWMGVFCVVAAAVRLYYAYQLSGATPPVLFGSGWLHISTNTLIWGQIEPSTSIVAACLPCLPGIMKNVHGPESLARSLRSIFKRTQASSLASLRRERRDEEAIKEESEREWHKLQEIGAKGSYHGGVETGSIPSTISNKDGIHMERAVVQSVEMS